MSFVLIKVSKSSTNYLNLVFRCRERKRKRGKLCGKYLGFLIPKNFKTSKMFPFHIRMNPSFLKIFFKERDIDRRREKDTKQQKERTEMLKRGRGREKQNIKTHSSFVKHFYQNSYPKHILETRKKIRILKN